MINKLKELLISTVDVEEDIQLYEDTVILRDLGVDSLEMVELVCAVEDEFDIEIADKKIKTLVTIGDLIDYIKSQQ
jgi:acyl carrier protein